MHITARLPRPRSTGAKTFEEDVCSVLAASKGGKQGYPPVGCPPGVWRVLVGGPPCQVRRSWLLIRQGGPMQCGMPPAAAAAWPGCRT